MTNNYFKGKIYQCTFKRRQIMPKTIFLVTHAEKKDFGSDQYPIEDPSMTEEGYARIAELGETLKKLLPTGATEVHCGTGNRQLEIAFALGYEIEDVFVSSVWGEAASFVNWKGKKCIILESSYGYIIDREKYLNPKKERCLKLFQ